MGLLAVLALAHSVAASHLQPRQSPSLDIVSLTKDVNATGGKGNVAAAGQLLPFGEVGVGCGISWAEEVSYGGETQNTLASTNLTGSLPQVASKQDHRILVWVEALRFDLKRWKLDWVWA